MSSMSAVHHVQLLLTEFLLAEFLLAEFLLAEFLLAEFLLAEFLLAEFLVELLLAEFLLSELLLSVRVAHGCDGEHSCLLFDFPKGAYKGAHTASVPGAQIGTVHHPQRMVVYQQSYGRISLIFCSNGSTSEDNEMDHGGSEPVN